MATEIGIEPTVRHSLDIGYLPIIVTDTCGTGNAEAPARSLAFAGGCLQTDARALDGLLARPGRSSTPAARPPVGRTACVQPTASPVEHPLVGDWHLGGMVLEHALLSVKPGTERVRGSVARPKRSSPAMAGFNRLALSRCVEQSGTYLLLAERRRLEDHIEGFRGSPRYQEWRQLLHHF